MDPVGSAEHTLGTTDIEGWELSDSEEDNTEQKTVIKMWELDCVL
jgi:hypothetical protein